METTTAYGMKEFAESQFAKCSIASDTECSGLLPYYHGISATCAPIILSLSYFFIKFFLEKHVFFKN